MFHPLSKQLTEGIELPQHFTNPIDYAPHPLVEIARGELCRYIESRKEWHAEIEQGKMFGVLVVENCHAQIGYLAAFSGYLDKQTIHHHFVPPIVNLLEPGGFFTTEENNISQINREIRELDSKCEIAAIKQKLELIEAQEREEIETLRQGYINARKHRRELRQQGCDDTTLARLSFESQHQRGAIKRREMEYRSIKEPLNRAVELHTERRNRLAEERQNRSAALQTLTFNQFQPLNALGEKQSLIEIFKHYNATTPPAGSGECAAPKLLHYAFENSLRPIAMGEFWWGRSTRSEVRRHMHYYPACRGKCHPILSYMLQGLQIEAPATPKCEESTLDKLSIIYEDQYIVAFNKPSGLPSVRGVNHTLSVQSFAEQRYPHVNPNNLIVHRLDMDTSGVLIIAKSSEVQASLQQQFAAHTIKKRYIALIEGIIEQRSGTIELPLALDPLDRPRQRVDYKNGKKAYTAYTVLSVEHGVSRIALYPQTGRTHQLRVHCAHPEGLNMPIVGDRLYGTAKQRLMLHAEQITLLHPATQRRFTLRAKMEF